MIRRRHRLRTALGALRGSRVSSDGELVCVEARRLREGEPGVVGGVEVRGSDCASITMWRPRKLPAGEIDAQYRHLQKD